MDAVETTVARNRMIVLALAGGVLVLAAVSGFVELQPVPLAVRGSLAVGLAGLIALVVGWRAYAALAARAAKEEKLEDGLARYTTALLTALSITEGVAFVGVVIFMLGGELVALTGVVSHVMLTGVLWPTAEKARPSR